MFRVSYCIGGLSQQVSIRRETKGDALQYRRKYPHQYRCVGDQRMPGGLRHEVVVVCSAYDASGRACPAVKSKTTYSVQIRRKSDSGSNVSKCHKGGTIGKIAYLRECGFLRPCTGFLPLLQSQAVSNYFSHIEDIAFEPFRHSNLFPSKLKFLVDMILSV